MLWITGADGQLGSALRHFFSNAIFTTRHDLDLTDEDAVEQFVSDNGIDKVINCAAYTHVDAAEKEAAKAYAVNTLAVTSLAKFCRTIVHISTDYVFDGAASRPYLPTDVTNPLNVYGKTKLSGEAAIFAHATTALIVRTSWLYSARGSNFIRTIYRLAQEQKSIRVVSDQVGSPTFAEDLACAIAVMEPHMVPNTKVVYHYANTGVASWYDIACEIVAYFALPCTVLPIRTDEYPTAAHRPQFSVLDTADTWKNFGMQPIWWKEALHRCLAQLKDAHSIGGRI